MRRPILGSWYVKINQHCSTYEHLRESTYLGMLLYR